MVAPSGCRLNQQLRCPEHPSNTRAATLPVLLAGSSLQLRPAASGHTCLELCALASVVLVIEKSFAVSSFTHVAVAASSADRLGISALTILTDFCLSVSEGDGVTGVVMFAPSSQDPNLSGRYSLSESMVVHAQRTDYSVQLLLLDDHQLTSRA